MQQHARGSLVDALGGRDQPDPGSIQDSVDLHIVGSISSQAVDLVDDHVVDVMVRDVVEHALQLGTISGLGRGSPVNKLFDHDGPKRRGLTPIGLALGWDGEAFGFTTSESLITRRHTQVGDGDPRG
ncbi:MAG: hypothetical protein M1274_04040 [Actinobacteria bacterium]|nr:hypothetical protein [Actinomycetota bacterium]